MARSWLVLVVMAALSWALAAEALGQTSLTATIGKKASLVGSGQAVSVEVEVTCPAGDEVLEAFAYVTQGGNTSQFGGIPVVCDGVTRTYGVQASSLAAPFTRGRARASAFVLLSSGESVSPSREIQIKK